MPINECTKDAPNLELLGLSTKATEEAKLNNLVDVGVDRVNKSASLVDSARNSLIIFDDLLTTDQSCPFAAWRN